jgi:hypothetical protein
MNLVQFQRRMSADVMRPLTSGFEMQQRADDGGSVEELAGEYVKPNDRLTSFDRLEIYNRQYWFRVIGAVSEDYPALAAVMGAKRFDALVLAYLKENPSTSFTLRNLGARLPSWLKDHPEFAPSRHSLLIDVAQLEWAYVEAYDGAGVPPLNSEDFVNLNGDSTLSLQPHLQLLSVQYPVDELVLAVHKENPESDIASNAVTERKKAKRLHLPRMVRAAGYLAVHRFDYSVYYRRIDREAWLLLSALQKHRTIAEAIDAAFAHSTLSVEEQATKIQEYFAHAAELGWFCSRPPDLIGVQ